jgi:RND family efflux transporter MFP subunit
MEGRILILALVGLAASLASGCRPKDPGGAPHGGEEGWAVTAWGQRYEVFAETGPLVAGAVATSGAHVTVLAGYAPLREGKVTIVLRGPGGELSFSQTKPRREGIFSVEIKPPSEGSFDLVFLVESAAGREEIPAGRVRVGSAAQPGGRIEQAAAQQGATIAFLKEQQWRTEFATAPVSEGTLADSVGGAAVVRPAAGGEVVLTAPVDATVASGPWPHIGMGVSPGGAVFRLHPRVADRSLPEIAAEASSLSAEVDVARRRVDRLTELLKVEATSAAELERARAVLASLEARLTSARGGLELAAGGKGPTAGALSVLAPWSGQVAEVSVSPGQTVAAGAPLGRLVKVRPLWIVAALRPEDAARVGAPPQALFLRRPGQPQTLEVASGIRLVSRSPEVDPRTASVAVILQVDRSASELPLGSAVEVEIVLSGERRGIVVPREALIDDSGTTVAYVQLEGEAFARREVRVLGRLGNAALVEGPRPGEHLVVRGAGAVRRSSLLSAGAPEGHVH